MLRNTYNICKPISINILFKKLLSVFYSFARLLVLFFPDSTRCDIGAYFFDHGVGINDGTPTGPYNFTLCPNYPNPFNSETIISYSLQKDALITLRVMSITGQLVKTLSINEHQIAGEHRVIWDGSDMRGQAVSTGIYFYELYADSYRESKAMILVR
jgi:hypothetical protein